MSNVAGIPNKGNMVLDEDGTFSDFWYRFMIQMWIRSGGSNDGIADLREALELVELRPKVTQAEQDDLSPAAISVIQQDDLTPVVINVAQQDDLSPTIEQTTEDTLVDLAPL